MRYGWMVLAGALALAGCADPPRRLIGEEDQTTELAETHLVRVTMGGELRPQEVSVAGGEAMIGFLNGKLDRPIVVRFPGQLIGDGDRFKQHGGDTFSRPISPGEVLSLNVPAREAIHFEVHGLKGGILAGTIKPAAKESQ